MNRVFRSVIGILWVSVLTTQSALGKEGRKPSPKSQSKAQSLKTAVFAGGCFWCMEPPFDKLKGVVSTTSGFAGGIKVNPSYKDVAGGRTQHVEAVSVQYDPKVVSFRTLVDTYWRQVDPTDGKGSFVDRGPHYRPVLYYANADEKKVIETSLAALKARKLYTKKIVVEITKKTTFFPAEDYHQDYYKKNPIRYKYYRYRSGRDQYLETIWGKTQGIKKP